MPPPHDPKLLLAQIDWVRALVKSLVRENDLAEDVTQATLAAAVERPPGGEPWSRAWLAAVARNFIKQQSRADGRRRHYETRAVRDDNVSSADEIVARAEAQRIVVNAVMRLDEPYRSTIILRYFEGLPPREIGALLQISVDTVQTRLSRAYEKLRAELSKSSGGGGDWMLAVGPLLAFSAPKSATFSQGLFAILLVNTKILATAIACLLILAALVFFMFRPEPTNEKPLVETSAIAKESGPRSTAGDGQPSPASAPREAAVNDILQKAPAASRSVTSAPAPSATTFEVRGRVIDCDSRAVAGVELEYRFGETVKFNILSDGEGKFNISTASESGEIKVNSERYITVLAGGIPAGSGRAETIVVVAPKITVGGMVINDLGNPFDGANVEYELPPDFRLRFRAVLDYSTTEHWQMTTNSGGRFEWKAVPDVRGARLSAEAPGYSKFTEPAPNQSRWDIVMKLARPMAARDEIHGRVLDATGAPAAQALVGDGENVVRTDSKGEFNIPGMKRSNVSITAVSKGALPASMDVIKNADGWPAEVLLRLGSESLTITGTLLDPSGKPVQKGTVWIVNAHYLGQSDDTLYILEGAMNGGGVDGGITQCDANGQFKITGLLAKKYVLGALDEKTLFTLKSEEIEAGASGVTLNLTKPEIIPVVAGTVVNGRGKPVAGVAIGVSVRTFVMRPNPSFEFSNGGGWSRVMRTDATGRFSLANVPRFGTTLTFDGDSIMTHAVSLAKETKPENMEIVVSERCHLRIELKNPQEAIDQFEIRDANDQRLTITILEGNRSMGTTVGGLLRGESHVVAVEDTARTLVLLSATKEVRRLPITLSSGEITVVRP